MKLYHKNPRQITEKQFTDLGGSLSRLGDLGGIVHDLNSDEVIGGNQRSRVFDINRCEIELVEQYLEPDEQGTVGLGFVVWKGKRYAYRQVRWTSEQCEEANIRANKAGGGWDFDTLANEFELGDLLEWGFTEHDLKLDYDISTEEQKESVKRDKPSTVIDLIFTQGWPRPYTESTCCLAVKSGFLYGFQSSMSPCLLSDQSFHKVEFVDNDYFDYSHAKHLDAVRKHSPKYCTVRDYMSEDQCNEAKIKYYQLEQILEWAEELNQYCKNVIVIPKVNVIDRIPEKFMLGYSVPTSHGGTPLPIEAFRGRRVHLLGGSPNKQIAFWQRLPNDIVSADNNYILKMANFGKAWFPDGKARSVTEMGFGEITNPRFIAFVASIGNMAAAFMKTGQEDAQIQDGEISED